MCLPPQVAGVESLWPAISLSEPVPEADHQLHRKLLAMEWEELPCY